MAKSKLPRPWNKGDIIAFKNQSYLWGHPGRGHIYGCGRHLTLPAGAPMEVIGTYSCGTYKQVNGEWVPSGSFMTHVLYDGQVWKFPTSPDDGSSHNPQRVTKAL